MNRMSKVYYSYFRSMWNRPSNTVYLDRKQQLRISDSINWNPCASAFNRVLALDESSKLTWVLVYSQFQNCLKLKSSVLFMCECSSAKLSLQFSVWNGINCLQINFLTEYKGAGSFVTPQRGALYVVCPWAYPWLVSQVTVSGFTGAFLHVERNGIDIYIVLFFTFCTVREKNERTTVQAFYAVC